MKTKTIIIVCSLFFIIGCSEAQKPGTVLAEVNGSKLTYQYLLDQFPAEYRASLTREQLANAVDAWIATELVYQVALKKNVDKKRQVQNLIEQKRKEIIASNFIDEDVAKDIKATDAEIDSIYNSRKQSYSVDEDLYKLSHIVLGNKEAAEAVYSRLLKGDDFGQLAADYSEDKDTRSTGGDIGLLSLSAFSKEMAKVISETKVGHFTVPLKSQSGYYHIFLVQDIKHAGEVLPLEEIRDDLSQSVIAEKRQAKYAAFIDSLKKTANIKRYPLDVK